MNRTEDENKSSSVLKMTSELGKIKWKTKTKTKEPIIRCQLIISLYSIIG